MAEGKEALLKTVCFGEGVEFHRRKAAHDDVRRHQEYQDFPPLLSIVRTTVALIERFLQRQLGAIEMICREVEESEVVEIRDSL